jgi:hypothetical protein
MRIEISDRPKIPSAESVEGLAKFWDTHDVTDFEDDLEEVTEPVFVRSNGPTPGIVPSPTEV